MPAALVLTPVAVAAALGALALAGGGPPAAGPPAAPALRTGAAPAAARFSWPLRPPPAVLRRFAVGPQPWSPGHRGVDLAAPAGAPVLAAAGGRVTFAGSVAGVGVVVVAHGELRTTYEPVTGSVARGAAVSQGQEIGTLAPSTAHCGRTCLHWGALRGDVYVDPLTLLGSGPPVLLPMGRS
jgi:murein DD-endopeptidase MepM/ murein hydrolase activator NlpD